ncbi:hypothetical protein RU639_005386 [Aspergillus parasiticus]
MKLHLAFLSAFASLAVAAVADIAPPFTEEPGGVENATTLMIFYLRRLMILGLKRITVKKWSDFSIERAKAQGAASSSIFPGKRDDVKDSTFPKNESTEVDYWSQISIEQNKAQWLNIPSTPPEKRDDVKDPTPSEKPLVSVADSRKTFIPTPDDLPPDFRPIVIWSPDRGKTCEKDNDCCRWDTCSKDKKCQGLLSDKFPRGYPKSSTIDFENSTEVEKWSKWSLDANRIEWQGFTPPKKRDDVKNPTSLEKPMEAVKPKIKFEPLPEEFHRILSRRLGGALAGKSVKAILTAVIRIYALRIKNYSNDTVVECWSKWSLDEDRIELEAFDSGVRAGH